MLKHEWVNFTITDLSFNEQITYTQKDFEEMVNDKFLAVELENDKPNYIWTEKFVFTILKYERFMGQLAISGAPRNPDWREEKEIKVVRSIEMDYFCNNFNQIIDQYKDKWICIKDEKVVSFGDTVKEVHDKCKELGIKRPFITRATKEGWEK